MYFIVLMLKNSTKSEKINWFSSSKVNITKINQTKTRFTLNRWKLMHHQWRNISCDGRTKKFYRLEIDNVHLLRIVYFLCILHRLFLLGTFSCLLFVLGTVFLIRTNSITRKLPLITLLIYELIKWFLHLSMQRTLPVDGHMTSSLARQHL